MNQMFSDLKTCESVRTLCSILQSELGSSNIPELIAYAHTTVWDHIIQHSGRSVSLAKRRNDWFASKKVTIQAADGYLIP